MRLFDTFEGIPEPAACDVNIKGESALDKFSKAGPSGTVGSRWCNVSLEEVRSNLLKVGYDSSKIHFVRGKVEDTIPEHAPEHIA